MKNSTVEGCKGIGLFVGDELAFSDNILKHTAAEFTSLYFMRSATLADALTTATEQAVQCRIILVDESEADALQDSLPAVFAHFPNTKVAMSYRQASIAEMVLRNAASDPLLAKVGVLPMRLEIDHWMSVLRLLICGERYIPYELFKHAPVAEHSIKPTPPKPTVPKGRLAKLTDRETQVLTSVSEGKQNKIIAAELALSEHTVKLHIHNVISKLGVNNRTEAAICFLADHPRPNG